MATSWLLLLLQLQLPLPLPLLQSNCKFNPMLCGTLLLLSPTKKIGVTRHDAAAQSALITLSI